MKRQEYHFIVTCVPSWMPVFVLMPSLVVGFQCGRAKYNTHFIPWKFHLIYWITLISSVIEHIDADVLQCECATCNATELERERECVKKPPREMTMDVEKKEWPPNSKNRAKITYVDDVRFTRITKSLPIRYSIAVWRLFKPLRIMPYRVCACCVNVLRGKLVSLPKLAHQ